MATKKQLPVKAVKKTGKPIAKKATQPVKSTPKKVVKVAPAKKIAPKKVVTKPIQKKIIKVAPKKAIAKPAAKKVIAKPVAKKVIAKPLAKKVLAKPVAKKVVAKVAPKKVNKPAPKSIKPPAKAAPKKAIPAKKIPILIKKPIINKAQSVKSIPPKAAKPASIIMAKKVESKVPAVKPAIIKVVSVKPVPEVKAKDIKVPAPKPVVIPKISTKTVRKYQPEFTKSVLDKAQRDPGAPSQRYSDVELHEFRELIHRKLEAAKKELSYLHGLITRKDELGGDESDNRYMTMEDGSLSMEREQLSQMASRQITFIDHLEKAIMRIENKTYGICRVTGKLIDKARLRAVPHATLSIEAKMSSSK
jgi:RNA polymerase-binding transcription factor DksA